MSTFCWFHPCNRTRHVLDRQLSPAEVQLAHENGLHFVDASTKLFGWFRGKYTPGTKIYFVEARLRPLARLQPLALYPHSRPERCTCGQDRHVFRWGVVERSTETTGTLPHQLWNNKKVWLHHGAQHDRQASDMSLTIACGAAATSHTAAGDALHGP